MERIIEDFFPSTNSNPWQKLQEVLKQIDALVKANPQAFPQLVRVFSNEATQETFLNYPLEFQLRSVEALREYANTLAEMTRNLEAPKNAKLFLWRALQRLKLIPSDELLEKIGDDEVIEIYSSEGVQMFRSFSLLEMISYSIEDLIVFPWDGLFYRNPEVTEKLMDQAVRLFSNQITTTQKNEITGKHIVCEIKSEEKKKFEIEFGIVSPLKPREHSNIAYFVSTIKTLRVIHE